MKRILFFCVSLCFVGTMIAQSVYHIQTNINGWGTVHLSSAYATQGETIMVTATPADEFELFSVICTYPDADTIAEIVLPLGNLSFKMPEQNVALNVVFRSATIGFWTNFNREYNEAMSDTVNDLALTGILSKTVAKAYIGRYPSAEDAYARIRASYGIRNVYGDSIRYTNDSAKIVQACKVAALGPKQSLRSNSRNILPEGGEFLADFALHFIVDTTYSIPFTDYKPESVSVNQFTDRDSILSREEAEFLIGYHTGYPYDMSVFTAGDKLQINFDLLKVGDNEHLDTLQRDSFEVSINTARPRIGQCDSLRMAYRCIKESGEYMIRVIPSFGALATQEPYLYSFLVTQEQETSIKYTPANTGNRSSRKYFCPAGVIIEHRGRRYNIVGQIVR